jgi:hypothetical protein
MEYALLVALIAVIAIAGVRILGQKTADKFCEGSGALETYSKAKYHYNPLTGKCEAPNFEN